MALEGLEGVIKGLESQASWQAQRNFRQILQHWPKAVGFAVARKTRPISIQRGTLYVATATAAWAQTLAYERLHILSKLNRHQNQPLKGIRFSSAQWAQALPDPKPASAIAAQHPSYIGEALNLENLAGLKPTASSPQTPNEAFQRWASIMQKIQSTQATCPQCRCRCPQGELDRWAICALCATKQWQSVSRR